MDNRRVRLIALEDGASEVDCRVCPDQREETVVIHQCDGELPGVFSGRIISRIGVFERSARSIDQAVIAVGDRFDDQAMAARHVLARALLTHVRSSLAGAAELVLAVDGDAGPALRHQLWTLAEALVADASGSRVPIRLRFGRSEPASPIGLSRLATLHVGASVSSSGVGANDGRRTQRVPHAPG
jgi:hypothetical protein